MTELLNDRQEVDEKLRALCGVYQTTASILAGESVKVSPENVGTLIPAWTTGTEITINSGVVQNRDFDDIVRMHGLIMHELSHVLYTPRAGTSIAKAVMDAGLQRSFNLLEDQRIESLLTSKYGSTSPWLTAAVLRWVVADPSSLATGLVYVHGRKYLGRQIISMFRKSFERPDLVPEVERIIDSYRSLVFPTDYDRAMGLIKDMDRLLLELHPYQGAKDCPFGHHHPCPGGWPSKGRPQSVGEQRDSRDKMDRADDKRDKAEQENPPEPALQDEPEEGEGKSSSEGDDSGRHDGANSGTSNDPQDCPGEAPEERRSDPKSTQPGTASFDFDEAAAQMADMLDQLLESKEVVDEISNTQKQVRAATGSDILDRARYSEMPVEPEFIQLSNELRGSLQRLVAQADAGWVRRTDHGRVNAVRWMTDQDLDTAYDRWDEGVHDVADIEVVILLDISGSMGSVIQASAQSMWALKRALDSIDIPTTVIAFDGQSELLYHRNDRSLSDTYRYSYKGGGTNPVRGLAQAARIFAGSKRSSKLLVVFTDGEWEIGRDEFRIGADSYIKKMRESGVVTALGFILDPEDRGLGYRYGSIEALIKANSHNAEYAATADGRNLVPFVSGIVQRSIKSRLRASA